MQKSAYKTGKTLNGDLVRVLLANKASDPRERNAKLQQIAGRGVTNGVLTQTPEPWKWPETYLSKKPGPVVAEWPPCLCIIVAIALLVKGEDKLTLGQNLIATTPHAIGGVFKQPSD